jgi:hypothetical protein
MSDDDAVIRRGEYTWHPIMPSLLVLIQDLRDSLKFQPTPANLGAYVSIAKYEKRLEKVAPKIIEMRAQRATRRQICDELGIATATLTKYIRDINEWGLGKC